MQDLKHGARLLCVIALAGGVFAPVFGQDAGRSVFKHGVINEDVYVAGEHVQLDAEVNGDVAAAGRRVVIERRVSGDVMAAGGAVTLRAQVLDDARVAGGWVSIEGEVGGDVLAAGGHVAITPNASVGERAWLAGGEIEVGGHVGKELRAIGDTIVISGVIDGDVELTGETIQVLPGAQVGGNLRYRSAKGADVSPLSKVGGNITHLPMGAHTDYSEATRGGVGIGVTIALFVAGLALLLVLPEFSVAAAKTLLNRPWVSLGVGLALLAAVPLAALVLTATVVGAFVGLSMLLLYAVALLAGWLIAALSLGDRGLRLIGGDPAPTRLRRVLSLAAALAATTLLCLLPWIGGLVALTLFSLGLGALALALHQRYRAAT